MKYQLADLRNGPHGDIFDTPEAATAALHKAINEEAEANIRDSDMLPDEAYAQARDTYWVVDVAELNRGRRR